MPAYDQELYDLYREYRQDPQDGKKRPNLVIAVSGEDVLCLPLSRTAPSNPPKPYDKWKVEVGDWREANLDQPSWVLVDDLKIFHSSAVSIRDMRGELSDDDMENVVQHSNQYSTYVARQRRRAKKQASIAAAKGSFRRK